MSKRSDTPNHDEPSWLEKVWMEVQSEIDAEELGERMDAEPEHCACLADQHELGCAWPRCRRG